MRPPSLRAGLPWLIGASLLATIACLAVAVYLGLAARAGATSRAALRMTVQANAFAREIEADLALFDLALLEAAKPDPGQTPRRLKLLELPLTARYVGFMNVLNEVGDVIADSRSNVSRPVNFAGRDYFQDQLKNPGDSLMIGRPFGTAPTQHASIPISRRLTTSDGAFAGVVVAGVRLTWLSDLLSHQMQGPPFSVTVRRSDGVILMRAPFDDDAIGRAGADDPAWLNFLRTGVSFADDEADGIRMFRHVGTAPLVLELSLDHAAGARSWLIWLPALVVTQGLFVLLLGITGHLILRRANRTEVAIHAGDDERMRILASMSHELRTPLTGILGQAELMTEEGGLNERQATRLTRLTEAGTLMRNIVNRVIDIARPPDHDQPPAREPCDLDALIRTCTGIVESEARAKGLHLTTMIDPATPRRAMLARYHVQQLLVNLLANAVKFTARGAVSSRVVGDAARLRFEIADTGPGVPASKWRRLFREYDRFDSRASGIEGTGIGLSISERLVRAMDGRIGYRDNPGGGSVFWIELPTPEMTGGAPDPVQEAPPVPAVAAVQTLMLLLADDLDLTRSVTADFLRQAGHVVTEVPDGRSAIDAVRTRDFDVILTDMRMPGMDGLETTRRIRALQGDRVHTPVVLVTADLAAIGRGRSAQSEVDFCLMKPFTRSELLAVVRLAATQPPPPQTHPPETPASEIPVPETQTLDEATLTDLKSGLGEAKFHSHLREAKMRIEDLLAMLSRPDAAESAVVGDAVHDLIGVTGLLGLTALSSCLRLFDIAEDRAGLVGPLREAAEATMADLRKQQVPADASSHSGGGG